MAEAKAEEVQEPCAAGGDAAAAPAPAPPNWGDLKGVDGAPFAPLSSALSLDERYALVRSVGEECIQVRRVGALCPLASTARGGERD